MGSCCTILNASSSLAHWLSSDLQQKARTLQQELKTVLRSLGIYKGLSIYWDLSKIRLEQLKCCSCCLDEWHSNSLYTCTLLSCLSVVLSGRSACLLCKGLTPCLSRVIRSTSDSLTSLVRLIKQALSLLAMNLMCCDGHKQGKKGESLNVSRSEKDLSVPPPERTGCVSRSDRSDFCIQERVNVETDVPGFSNTGFLSKWLFICGPCLTIKSECAFL